MNGPAHPDYLAQLQTHLYDLGAIRGQLARMAPPPLAIMNNIQQAQRSLERAIELLSRETEEGDSRWA